MRERDEYGRFREVQHDKFHKGYKVVYMPDHPHSRANGYVYEHILNAEKKIGCSLADNEVVHHIDGNKLNNSPDNLMVFSSQSEHDKWHWQRRSNRYSASDGKVYTIKELADITGSDYFTVYQRIKRLGWTADNVLTGRKKKSPYMSSRRDRKVRGGTAER